MLKNSFLYGIFIFLFTFSLFPDNSDDLFFDIEIPGMTTSIDDIQKPDFKSTIKGDVSVTEKAGFNYLFIRDSSINNKNLFNIKNYKLESDTRIISSINFSTIAVLHGDARFNLNISEDSKNISADLNELYAAFTVPIIYPIKFTIGRAFFRQENSFIFNVFNGLSYNRKIIGGVFTDNEPGANMFKISVFFPIVSFDIIYSPGTYVESDFAEYFNIPKEQRFYSMINFSLDRVSFGLNGFFDSTFHWGAGATIAVNVYDDLILYTDLSINNYNTKKRLVKKPDILYDDMHLYDWNESMDKNFSGTLIGINFSPKSFIDIYTELFYNSNGFTIDEQKTFFNNIEDIQSHYKNPKFPLLAPNAAELNKSFSSYYYGLLGTAMNYYNAFELGSLFVLNKIGKSDIKSTGLSLCLTAITYIMDGSTLLIPEISYDFLKFFTIKLKSDIFLGYPNSLFGEMPYHAVLNLECIIKI